MTEPITVSPDEFRAMLAKEQAKEQAKPRNKYRAQRCEIHQPAHDSLGECQRFMELQQMQRAGLIRNLKEKPRFRLCPDPCPAKHRHLVYEADWTYEELVKGEWSFVIEDHKSPATRTQRYIAKKTLMESRGYTIRETGAK